MNFQDKIKVSVIVPVYNVEKYLRECLNSLVNQTLKEMEFIFVDNASTDKSLERNTNYNIFYAICKEPTRFFRFIERNHNSSTSFNFRTSAPASKINFLYT